MKHIIYILLIFLFSTTKAQKLDSLQAVLTFHLALNDSINICHTYYSLGNLYFYSDNYYKAGSYYDEALKYGDSRQKLSIYNKQGTINLRNGDLDNAMSLFRNALSISENLEEKKLQAMLLHNIGFLYAEYDNHEKALEYYVKALKIREEIKDEKGTGMSNNAVGREYFAMDSLSISLEYFNTALKIFRDINYVKGEANVLNNIGNIYLKKEQAGLAMKYHVESLEIRKSINDLRGIAESYKNIAKVHMQDGSYKDAELTIGKGISFSEQIQSIRMLNKFNYQLYELNKYKKDYEKALANYLVFSVTKDSILSVESENKIAELEIQYQTEKKEQQITLLNTKDELNSQIISKQKFSLIFLIAGSGILLISLIIVLINYFQKNKAYKMLVKQNIEIVNLERAKNHKLSSKAISNEQQIVNDLLSAIEGDKCFLNPTCTIDELAKKIDTNRQYLSTIINDKFNSNFNSFINTYRIKEARKLLLDKEYDKYTIDAIANLSGFNNRATFNIAFKKNTGITPSFFKKEQSFLVSKN